MSAETATKPARSCNKCGAEFGDEIRRWYYHVCGDTSTAKSKQVKLEQVVIDAAIVLAQTSDHIDQRGEWEDNESKLLDAATALLKAGETK